MAAVGNSSSSSTSSPASTAAATSTSSFFKPALSSAVCSPLAGSTAGDCKRCYAAGCKLCEVGPELSYWQVRGTAQENAPRGKHDFACILSALKCETLRYTRPNTQFTMQIPYWDCDKVFLTTTISTAAPVTKAPPIRAAPDKEPMWSGDPGDWGFAQWTVLSVPLMVLSFALFFVYCMMRKRRALLLQRVYVEPQKELTSRGVETKVHWDLAQAGRITSQELQKIWKAIKDAEHVEGTGSTLARRLAFGTRNDLKAEHLKMIGAMLRSHSRVSVCLDTDWRFSDDACLTALTFLLGWRDRCLLNSPDGISTLRLPTDSSPAVVDALVTALSTAVHPEVDAIAFAPPGPWPPPHSVKGSAAVSLSSLRLTCQELVIRRCMMGDLGAVAVCAFVRPWAARIQTIRLVECEIGDDGAAALARLLGPNVRELCLTSNSVGDEGITEIAVALSGCDCLERLLLDRNNIGNTGAKALGNHLPRSNVQELTLGSHLGGNPVGEEGIEALALALNDELPRAAANRATRLRAVNLDGCAIGQRGSKALASTLPKSAIMALSVARGRIGDSGAEAIIQSLPRTCLSLDLSGNGLTDSTAASVAEVFYRIPQLAVSLANNYMSVGLRQILHEEHGSRLRL